MNTLLAVFLALVAFDAVMSLAMKDCGSKAGKVNSVTLSTPGGLQGFLTLGKQATLTVSFTSYSVSKNLVAIVKGDVVVWVPFELPNPNACTQGVTCPTSAGSTYTFTTSFDVPPQYRAIHYLVIKVELKDDKDNNMICVEMPAEIV